MAHGYCNTINARTVNEIARQIDLASIHSIRHLFGHLFGGVNLPRVPPQIVGHYDDWNKTVHGIYYYFSLPPNDQQIIIAAKLTKKQRNQYERTTDNLMTNRPLPYFTTIKTPSKLSSRQQAIQLKKLISLSAERSQQKQ